MMFSSLRLRWQLGKLRVLSGKEVCAILAKHGFLEMRRRGCHIVMQKKLSEGTITVPVPDHNEIRIGTLMPEKGDRTDETATDSLTETCELRWQDV